MSKKLLVPIKLIITAVVFYWVLHKLGPQGLKDLYQSARHAHLGWLLLAVGIFIFILGLGICRWHCLLVTQGIRLPYYQTSWIVAVGAFFNVFLIGSTGGDVLKAWYVAEAAPTRKAQAVFSVLVDRLIGLMGLFVLATICVLFHFSELLQIERTRPLAYLILIAFVGAVVAVALSTQHHRISSKAWWKWCWQYLPAKGLLLKLLESYNLYAKYPRILALTLLISVVVHSAGVLLAWAIGHAIEVQGVSLTDYFIYCPLINAFAALPITVGGLGLREGAFKFFFTDLLHVPAAQAVALSLLCYGTNVVVSLLCGIFYMAGKPLSAEPVMAPAETRTPLEALASTRPPD